MTGNKVPDPWVRPIESWMIHLAAQGARRDTRTTRRQHIERLARRTDLGPWALSAGDLLDYVGGADWAPETRRAHRSSLRGFYAWGVEVGHVSTSPALRLPRVKPSQPNPMPAPDSVYKPALLAADERETLMLRLAAEHGMRRGEIAVVHSRDLIEDLAGWTLVVHGKGGRQRLVPLLDDVAGILRRLPHGWAFPGDEAGHLSARWVGTLINRLLPGEWTIHKLRHRAATRWWEASNGDLLLVADLLGHSSVDITRRYVLAPQGRLRVAVVAAAA